MKIEAGATRPEVVWSRGGPFSHSAAAPASGQLHARIVDEIGMRIVSGDLKPGDVLPNATDWAASLGVSLTAFRESIKVLAGKGVIEARPKTGIRVRARRFWNHLDPDLLSWRYGSGVDDDARDLFELRRMVEPAAAAIAAERADPTMIADLEAAYREMETASDDGDLLIDPDLRFHQLILQMTNNELIGSLAALTETALVISFRLSNDNPAGQRPSLPLHWAVLDAIRRHDGPSARQAMETLLSEAEADVRNAAAVRRARRGRKRA